MQNAEFLNANFLLRKVVYCDNFFSRQVVKSHRLPHGIQIHDKKLQNNTYVQQYKTPINTKKQETWPRVYFLFENGCVSTLLILIDERSSLNDSISYLHVNLSLGLVFLLRSSRVCSDGMICTASIIGWRKSMSPVPEAPKQSPSGWRPSPLPPRCCLTAHLRKTSPCLPPRRPPASWPREHWSGVVPGLAPLLYRSRIAASAVGNGAHVLGNRTKGRRMLALLPSRRTGRRWTVDFSLPSSDPWLRSSFAL